MKERAVEETQQEESEPLRGDQEKTMVGEAEERRFEKVPQSWVKR